MELLAWLLEVLELFNHVLDVVFNVPILRFFLMVLLFFAVLSLLTYLLYQVRRGKL